MPKPCSNSRRGIALVVVLSMVVLITVLVVSFTVNMRTERQASHTMSENERTKLVAEAALAHAISILSTNIPQPVPPGRTSTPSNWAVNPGLLNIITGASDVTQIPLSTNPTANYVSTPTDANLNLLQASTNQHPIIGSGEPMCVAWAPMLQNPAIPASAANPIVARYAFWIDDENAKVNVNTAYGNKPPATAYSKLNPGTITETSTPAVGPDEIVPLGHPGSVELGALDTIGYTVNPARLLHSLKTYGASKTPEIIKTAVTNGDPEAFYQANKFYLTATSRDPEFNVFGKSRLFMYAGPTGQLDTAAGGGMFQRFRDLDAPMYFHGNENNSASAKDQTAMYYTAANLSSIFARHDWPGMPAVSFVDKWDRDGNGNPYTMTYPFLKPGEVGNREADQIAWNIVTMGSFCDYTYNEATPGAFAKFGNAIPAIRTKPGKTGSNGSINYPNAAVPVGYLSGKAIIPAAPRPMVDEICLNIQPQSRYDAKGKLTGYYLEFALSYGLWLPPGYPITDFSQSLDSGQTSCDLLVGSTHLDYTIKQNGVVKSSQGDSKYLNNDNNGVKKGQALIATGSMTPGQRIPLLPILNVSDADITPTWYARNEKGFSDSPVGNVLFANGMVNIDVNIRLYAHSSRPLTSLPSQLIPLWDRHDTGATAAPTNWQYNTAPTLDLDSQVYRTFSPPADDPTDCIHFNFDLDLTSLSDTQVTRSLQIADPRMSGLARMWKASWQDAFGHDLPGVASMADTDSLFAPHNAQTDAEVAKGWQLNKFAYIDMAAGTTLPHPSIGMFSVVPTGMQRGIVGSNLKLQPNPNPTTQLPDWLLLDLFASTVSPLPNSTAWADIVKMNSTAGKINVNAGIYPNSGSFRPPARRLPLQALFTNTPAGPNVAQNIIDHTLAAGGNHYAGGGKFYNYVGEICEIKDVADNGATDWDKEATVRNLASALSSRSNVFCVWGVAQTIKKLPNHHQYGQYESGDQVTGEKRFQAIVERYVWLGADGIAGNGHISASGTYDLLTQGAAVPGAGPTPASGKAYNWETLDGLDTPTYPVSLAVDPNNVTSDAQCDPYNKNALANYSFSPIESANNPVRPVMKYRLIFFKYLD